MENAIHIQEFCINHGGKQRSSLLMVNESRRYNYDPTRTTVLRQAFVREMTKRINQLVRDIKKAIIDKDVFGLEIPQGYAELGDKQFKFVTSQKKVDGFMSWLKEQEKQGILKTTTINQLGESIEKPWTNLYIEDSYKRGVMRATAEMKKLNVPQPGFTDESIQATMANPFHAERVGVLYSRVFEELKGVCAQMDQQISRVLSQGLIDGDNPRTLAAKLNKVITGTGKSLDITDSLGRFIPARRRAEMIARTEVIRAHHQATIQQYKNWGLEGVKVKAEWSTAGDDRVCDRCAGMHGNVYTLREIETMIPAHPNCRCIALPSLVENAQQESEVVWNDLTLDDITNNYAQFSNLGVSGITISDSAYYLGKKEMLTKINIAGRTIQDDIVNKLPKVKNWAAKSAENRILLDFEGKILNSNTICGCYYPNEKSMTIATKIINRTTYTPTVGFGAHNIGGAALPSTVAHEYGHFLFHQKLLGKERKAWNYIYEPRKYYGKGAKEVSKYGSSNPQEFFAESFAAYTHKNYKFGDLPKDIEDFMINNFGKRSDL